MPPRSEDIVREPARRLTIEKLLDERLTPPPGVGPVTLADFERAVAEGACGVGAEDDEQTPCEKHKVTIAPPTNRAIAVEISGGFFPGKVEIGVMFRVGRMEAPQAVSPKTTELSEAFKRRYPLAGTFGTVVFHDDPAAPLDPADWGDDLI